MLASRLFLEQIIASKVSCRGDMMHSFGGTVMKELCVLWWIGGTALVNGGWIFSVSRREVAEEEVHPYHLG